MGTEAQSLTPQNSFDNSPEAYIPSQAQGDRIETTNKRSPEELVEAAQRRYSDHVRRITGNEPNPRFLHAIGVRIGRVAYLHSKKPQDT